MSRILYRMFLFAVPPQVTRLTAGGRARVRRCHEGATASTVGQLPPIAKTAPDRTRNLGERSISTTTVAVDLSASPEFRTRHALEHRLAAQTEARPVQESKSSTRPLASRFTAWMLAPVDYPLNVRRLLVQNASSEAARD